MTIARLIEGHSPDIISCDAATSVRDAVALLSEKRIGALPVFRDGQIAGIFSERDVVYQLAAHGPAMLDKTVAEVMTAGHHGRKTSGCARCAGDDDPAADPPSAGGGKRRSGRIRVDR